jgi:hypothetical protein
MSITNCYTNLFFNALFLQTPYQITAGTINIQNIATGQSFIGKYSQNQFTVPVAGGLATPVTLEIIDPTTGQVIVTLNDQITFTLGEVNQCYTTNETTGQITTITYNANLSGYSQYFGPISTNVVLDSGWSFIIFKNTINTAFQTTINGESYSISANGVYIQKA